MRINSCSGTMLYFGPRGIESSDLAISNVFLADSYCYTSCIDIYLAVINPAVNINEIYITNVQSSDEHNTNYITTVNSAYDTQTSLNFNNFTVLNAVGFNETIYYALSNITINEPWNINVNTSANTIAPPFYCVQSEGTALAVNTTLGLPLADLFEAGNQCYVSYLGFGFISISPPEPMIPTGDEDNGLYTIGLISVVAVVVIACTLAFCFFIYKKVIATTYSTIK